MGSLLRTALISTGVAAVAVVIAFVIGDLVSGPLMATQPGAEEPAEVALGNAVGATVFGGIVGTVLAFVSSRLGRPVQIFTSICVIGLILYGIMAFSAADGFAAGLWLNIMHLAAAVPIVGGLSRWLAERQPATA